MQTRLTKALNIEHPILGAPMAFASGGVLAAATTNAGGLGFIGGGYGDADWLDEQFAAVGNTDVGCGFITWSLANNPALLEQVLDKSPRALFLSFGDPAPFAAQIHAANVPLICQIQTLRDAKHAIDQGAQFIVAQGTEAGGHGETRTTFTLVPEVADYIGQNAPETILIAAGGVADGRGLAAAMMLGADGVLIGSRLLAAQEALVHPNMLQTIINASGDDALRSNIVDIVRSRDWPERYTINLIQNAFSHQWHNNSDELRNRADVHKAWNDALVDGDSTIANVFAGQGAGLICAPNSVANIIDEIMAEAAQHLSRWA